MIIQKQHPPKHSPSTLAQHSHGQQAWLAWALAPLLALLLGWMVALAPTTAHANPAKTQARCHLVVLGDSLSAAYGLPAAQGWVALLQAKLQHKAPHCTVFNASISGDTTAGGKARLAALLQSQKPNVVLIALGGNDGLRGLPIDSMQKNLSDMLTLAAQNRATAVLIGMRIPPNYGPRYSQAFAQSFVDLAQQHRAPLVPFLLEGFADKPDWFQDDGIHPNARAQSTMLNTVWPTLQALLR